MRDYSFGNFISAMRERTGLSQYQLGALVGVTDKAVSKWENGVSKPRIGIIRKLSEVLDVGVDELLTCEYDTFNKDRKDLFAMRNEILDVAKKKLKELYGDNPPMRIKNRFKTEELMLNGQDSLLWMGFLGKLHEVFCKEEVCFHVRDAQMGASFVAWLLGGTNVNPLPAHYYCSECKKMEFIPDQKCGIDLQDKKCSCGSFYKKDGFGVDAMNMYPFVKLLEIDVSSGGTELVRVCLKNYFNEYRELRELKVVSEGVEVDSSEQYKITRFMLFSDEIKKKYPNEEIVVCPEEYYELREAVGYGLTVIEDKFEKMSMQDMLKTEFTAQQIGAYCTYAVENDKCIDVVTGVNFGRILSEQIPSFSTLLCIQGLLSSTGTWVDNAEFLYDKGIPMEKLIFCREDVYDYLYGKLQGVCCENPSGLVFEIKEAVRKGRYKRYGMPTDIESLLLDSDVPEWYVDSMKKISYLFPKTHLITVLKRKICSFIKMNEM